MEKFLWIGLGGGLGSVLRYWVSARVQSAAENVSFPLGTAAVNIAGCFVIGLLAYLSDTRNVFDSEVRTFLFLGLMGGFTTFSTFGNETVNLIRGGEYLPAAVNVLAQVGLGLAAVVAGRMAAQFLWR